MTLFEKNMDMEQPDLIEMPKVHDLTGLKPGEVSFRVPDDEFKIVMRLRLKGYEDIVFPFNKRWDGTPDFKTPFFSWLGSRSSVMANLKLPPWIESKLRMLAMRRIRQYRRQNDLGPKSLPQWLPSDEEKL